MDDLQRAVARNLSGREAEVARARSLIDDEVLRFERWLSTLEVVPTIAALRERGEAIVTRILSENEGRWESLSEADRERVATLARAVVSRLLHEPTTRIKAVADRDDSYLYVSALRELFGLDAGTEPEGGSADVTSLEDRRRRSGR
jgi:glutamyl-tRNA reductase